VTQSVRGDGAAETWLARSVNPIAAPEMSAMGFFRLIEISVYAAVTPTGTDRSRSSKVGSGRPEGRARAEQLRQSIQLPMASVTHFFVKLSFAAPASFLSAAVLSQADFALVSHFFMKLVIAAPASFLPVASTLHDAAYALPQVIKNAVTRASAFIAVLLV
jgi:hypothetical protein